MSEPFAIYLLEAYAGAAGVGQPSADDLRAEIEGHDGVRVLGLVGVPADEAILCLVAADSADGEAGVLALADRYGAAARLLRVSWVPGAGPAESAISP